MDMFMVVLIVLIGNVAFFGTIVAVVLIPRILKNRERKQIQDTIRAAIDKGQPLPPEVLDVMTRDVRSAPSSRQRDVRLGILWLAIGIGLGVIGWMFTGFDTSEPGPFIGFFAIPGVIGIAFIVLSFFNKSKA
jgi:membrane associated rhomboid family serine protease